MPADLPVWQSTKTDLAIKMMKTANVLAITFPLSPLVIPSR
jgi:hypothetical protein